MMQFDVDKTALIAALQKVAPAAGKSSLPILETVLVEADSANVLHLTASNLDITLQTQCPATVTEPGRVALPMKRLLQTAQSMSADEITFTLGDDNWVSIRAGAAQIRLAGLNAADFPIQPPHQNEPDTITTTSPILLDALSKVVFATATGESRVTFMGVFCRAVGDVLQMVATDGHRLSKIEIPISGAGPIWQGGVIVPRSALLAIAKVVPPKPPCDVYLWAARNEQEGTGRQVHLSHPAVELDARLIEGRYPNFEQVIPKTYKLSFKTNRTELAQILKRAGGYTVATGGIRLKFGNGMCVVEAAFNGVGEFVESIKGESGGSGEILVGMNYKYLLEVLSVVEADEVSIGLNDIESPIAIKDSSRPETDYIVMPIQF